MPPGARSIKRYLSPVNVDESDRYKAHPRTSRGAGAGSEAGEGDCSMDMGRIADSEQQQDQLQHMEELLQAKDDEISVLQQKLEHFRSWLSSLQVQVQAKDPQLLKNARRLYIGGIPEGTKEDELRAFFDDVMNSTGATISPGSAITTCKVSSDKSYAFLELRSVEEASNAMAFDGIVFKDTNLKIRRPSNYNAADTLALGPVSPDPTLDTSHLPMCKTVVEDSWNKIFVGGLPCNYGDDQVKELLAPYGSLKSFNLVMDKNTGKSKGYAFCEFTDPRVIPAVIQGLHMQCLERKVLTVKRALEGNRQGGGSKYMAPPLGLAGTSGSTGRLTAAAAAAGSTSSSSSSSALHRQGSEQQQQAGGGGGAAGFTGQQQQQQQQGFAGSRSNAPGGRAGFSQQGPAGSGTGPRHMHSGSSGGGSSSMGQEQQQQQPGPPGGAGLGFTGFYMPGGVYHGGGDPSGFPGMPPVMPGQQPGFGSGGRNNGGHGGNNFGSNGSSSGVGGPYSRQQLQQGVGGRTGHSGSGEAGGGSGGSGGPHEFPAAAAAAGTYSPGGFMGMQQQQQYQPTMMHGRHGMLPQNPRSGQGLGHLNPVGHKGSSPGQHGGGHGHHSGQISGSGGPRVDIPGVPQYMSPRQQYMGHGGPVMMTHTPGTPSPHPPTPPAAASQLLSLNQHAMIGGSSGGSSKGAADGSSSGQGVTRSGSLGPSGTSGAAFGNSASSPVAAITTGRMSMGRPGVECMSPGIGGGAATAAAALGLGRPGRSSSTGGDAAAAAVLHDQPPASISSSNSSLYHHDSMSQADAAVAAAIAAKAVAAANAGAAAVNGREDSGDGSSVSALAAEAAA